MDSQTIADHIQREIVAVPDSPNTIEAVVRRGNRRRRGRRATWAIGALTLAFLFVMFPVPYDSSLELVRRGERRGRRGRGDGSRETR